MILRCFIIIMLFALPVKAQVSWSDSARIITWLTDNSDYEWNGEPLPKVKFETIENMCITLFPEGVPDPCNIGGYYNDETNEIFIATTPTEHMVEERYEESVLVHELVHFLQKINGTYETIECRRGLEKDAFHLQDKYIDEFGLPEELHNDPLWALVMSSCPQMRGFLGEGGG